jgi:hypothetical protein
MVVSCRAAPAGKSRKPPLVRRIAASPPAKKRVRRA